MPRIPEINIDPAPSAEIPKPFKENIWLDLANIKQKLSLQFQGPSGHLIQQTNKKTQQKPNTTDKTSTETLKDLNKTTERDTQTKPETNNLKDLESTTVKQTANKVDTPKTANQNEQDITNTNKTDLTLKTEE